MACSLFGRSEVISSTGDRAALPELPQARRALRPPTDQFLPDIVVGHAGAVCTRPSHDRVLLLVRSPYTVGQPGSVTSTQRQLRPQGGDVPGCCPDRAVTRAVRDQPCVGTG